MLFNSIDFAIFLPVVFILYWFVTNKKLKLQNLLIVIASYFFYGLWDWRFLSLIAFSTTIDYFVGIGLSKEKNDFKRKLFLYTSIFVNLSFLFFFKYYNFFVDSFVNTFSFLGYQFEGTHLNIILPVGISFYTFQTLSYSIDVYKRKLEPTKDFITFSAFVSFFPQLVAGPIERASNLLPQFYKKRVFSHQNAVDGLRQILWGMFKKVVIADNCAEYANLFFEQPDNYSGGTLFLGALFFTFQIYGDFSGYSDIAIGTSRLFGFNLMQNFAFPYFSRDIAEFWRRWHISLSSWFRDYLYIPLGGSKGGKVSQIRNTFIIFIVSGFWHGANWTFIVWGALNAIYFLPLLLLQRNRKNIHIIGIGRYFPPIKDLLAMLFTFVITVLTWVFFRAENIESAFHYLSRIFSGSILEISTFKNYEAAHILLILLVFFIIIEWFGREGKYALEKIALQCPRILRWSFYTFIIFLIGMFAPTEESPFIYFQF